MTAMADVAEWRDGFGEGRGISRVGIMLDTLSSI